MRTGIALALLALLGACAEAPRPDQSAPARVTADWLIGHWAPDGQSCESDAGVRYDRDGTWVAYETAGTWRIEGSSLVSTVTHEWPGDAEVRLPAPERHVAQIEVLGPDTYRSRWADGTVMTLDRCPDWRK